MSTHAVTQTGTWDGTPPQVPDGSSSSGNANNTMGDATAVVQAFVTKLYNNGVYVYNRINTLNSALTAGLAAAARLAGGNSFTGTQNIAGTVNLTGSSNTLTVAGSVTIGGDVVVDEDLVVEEDLIVTDRVTLNGNQINIPNGSLNVGSGSLHMTSGSIDAGGNIETTGGDLLVSGAHRARYTGNAASRRRTLRVHWAGGVANVPTSALIFGGSNWQSVASGYVLSVPLPQLSNLTVIEQVRLRYFASGAGGSVSLIRHAISDWEDGGASPSATSLGSAAITVGAGARTAEFTLATPEVVNNEDNAYWLRVNGDASASHTLYGAAIVVQLYSPGID